MLNNMQIVFGVYEAGNGHVFRFHKVEPMLVRGLPTISPLLKLGLLKIVSVCLLDIKCPCVIRMNLLKIE